MFAKPFEFCLAVAGKAVPAGPDWIHEIKYDGYRMRLVREDDRVRLFTRGGHDWTDRYPLPVAAAMKKRRKHFMIDGELVVLRPDGVADFNLLHSRKHDREAQLYAFDMLALEEEDMRPLPLSERKDRLADLIRKPTPGLFLADYEQGSIGPELFRHACLMGLEGIVSKHIHRPYRSGRSEHWVKNKNRQHPAMFRVEDRF